MIIDRYGNVMDSFSQSYGDIIHDGNFAICLRYENDEDVQKKRLILKLKNDLRTTDYKAIKYAEGIISEEDYASIKKSRQAIRDKINEIEPTITRPTITDEEMKAAEEIAVNNGKLNALKSEVDSLQNAFVLSTIGKGYNDEYLSKLQSEYWEDHNIQTKVDQIHSLQEQINNKLEFIKKGENKE